MDVSLIHVLRLVALRKMLESGHPPDDWDQLLSQVELAGNRLMQAFNTLNMP
jgi:toxin YhaV